MPRKTDSNNPRDWLYFVEEDLNALRLLAAQEVSYHLCLSKLAETLEKTLKAALIQRGWFLRKIHDLQKLVDELGDLDTELAAIAQPLAEDLAEAYFVDRYPGFDLEDPDWPGLKRRLAEVEDLLATVKSAIPPCDAPESPEPGE